MTAEKFLGRVGKWAPEDMWPCVRVNSRGLGDGKVGGGAGSYEVGSTEKCREECGSGSEVKGSAKTT